MGFCFSHVVVISRHRSCCQQRTAIFLGGHINLIDTVIALSAVAVAEICTSRTRFLMSFKPNPYFEDTKLVRVFRFSDDGTTSVSGTSIHWKDGMDDEPDDDDDNES
ncbi:hypothetical protein O6H91_18G069000 [Diphasiastrum complanatum]|uniref:Uncharacterized protein n=1 Tax=Diphasiastrum complanatum TaxID=34168 RepID=A0ACC2B2D4_DIPCM|nr:hypothetical protein O6H91_18G069000 [Diphasiastrum complanatum]